MLIDTQLLTVSLVFVVITSVLIFKPNPIVILLLIEVVFLSSSLNCVIAGHYLGDPRGQIFAFILLTVSAAELAIALSAVVIYYKIYDK